VGIRHYSGNGVVFIDGTKARQGGHLKTNTRLSICLNEEYVAIMDVNLPIGVELGSGAEHTIPLRLLTDRELELAELYEIRDPIKPIGWLRLLNLEIEN
jgi:hypothetical protein